MVVGGFFLSYGIRTQPTNYAMELDEFDPHFNYRAAKYLQDNGMEAYMNWHDELSWYPHGRDVFDTSQVMLHVTAVALYQPFVDSISFKDFIIYFPAIIGSATVVPIFLLMTKITNRRIGGMAAVFFGCSVPFIQRGMAGWYKSEPLGLFYGIFAMYFMVAGVMSILSGQKRGIIQLVIAGVFIAVGMASWGGVLFFLMPMVFWLMTIPAFKTKLRQGIGLFANADGSDKENENIGYHLKTLLIGLGALVATLYLVSQPFERASILIGGPVTLAFVFVIGFLIFEHFMNKKVPYRVTIAAVFGIIIVIGVVGLTPSSYGLAMRSDQCLEECPLIRLPLDRYMKVLLPYDPNPTTLSSSVAEHQVPEISHIFVRTVFLFIFTPIGVFAILKKQVPVIPASFALIMSIMAMYVGSTFVRLELFSALGMILLASIGILYILQKFEQSVTGKGGRTLSENQLRKRKMKGYIIVIFLLGTMMYPAVLNWSIMMDRPPLIMFGGSMLGTEGTTNDWLDTLEWIKTNTPEDSKIMAWWDYGYWIQTWGERTTYMDNAAHMPNVIIDNANMLTDEPDRAVERLQEKEVDYDINLFHWSKSR